jgi:ACT domain-containing protein
MNFSTYARLKPSLLLSTLLGGMLLTSCASAANKAQAPSAESMQMQPAMDAPAAGNTSAINAKASAPTKTAQADAQVPKATPQLVKKAEIGLRVNSIEQTFRAVSKIVKQQRGDLLGLQDQKPIEESARRTASMEMRVPQNSLETTLDTLAQLGTVQRRSLTAEDVTTQLVDGEARLRNLRRQESTLQKIMDRSGSIPDVLRVAQELSNVRETIEQIDAQVKSLHNQVAYSTISLSLEEGIASKLPDQTLGLQVEDTWDRATHSVGAFTANLLSIGIWLLAYSPYLLLLSGIACLGYVRHRQRHSQQPDTRNSR